MIKRLLLLAAVPMFLTITVEGQGLLKKVTGAMKDELLGTGKSTPAVSEPSCACDGALLVVGLGGSLQINYKEMNISSMDDGSLLLKDKISGNFYIVRGSVTSGPFMMGDSEIAGFEYPEDENTQESILSRHKEYISRSGNKYIISFLGKTYGPYSEISQFAVTRSKDKFAALVIENIVVDNSEGKNMDEAINNAGSDQEKMELAMQYAQQIQQKIMEGGGPEAMTPKVVTNIQGSTFNPLTDGIFNGNMKYDNILATRYNKVVDMQGNNIISLKPEHTGAEKLFINTTNTRYVVYDYGTLIFNDGSSLSDLFNPGLVKTDGKIYLSYMYYSPKRNAIMQCKIPF
jgi:hypothetical protein